MTKTILCIVGAVIVLFTVSLWLERQSNAEQARLEQRLKTAQEQAKKARKQYEAERIRTDQVIEELEEKNSERQARIENLQREQHQAQVVISQRSLEIGELQRRLAEIPQTPDSIAEEHCPELPVLRRTYSEVLVQLGDVTAAYEREQVITAEQEKIILAKTRQLAKCTDLLEVCDSALVRTLEEAGAAKDLSMAYKESFWQKILPNLQIGVGPVITIDGRAGLGFYAGLGYTVK